MEASVEVSMGISTEVPMEATSMEASVEALDRTYFHGSTGSFHRPWKLPWNLPWKELPWAPTEASMEVSVESSVETSGTWNLPWKKPSVGIHGSFWHVESSVETSMEASSVEVNESFRGSFWHLEDAVDKLPRKPSMETTFMDFAKASVKASGTSMEARESY